MDSPRRIIAAALLAVLACGAAAGQRPSEPQKLPADEILRQELTACYTHVTLKLEKLDEYLNECVNIRQVKVQDLLFDSFFNYYSDIAPVGFAAAAFGDAEAPRDFDPAGLSVQDLLDSIVAADSRYQWSVEDGVINVLPAAGRPPLLDVRLAEFEGKGDAVALSRVLKERPEVRRRAAELGFDTEQKSCEECGFIFIGFVGRTPTYEIHCRDCTVLEVLNEIARQSRGSWMYEESTFDGKKDFYFTQISPTE